MLREAILEKIRGLRVDKATGRRAPHKPLLLLLAIAKLQNNVRQIPFPEVEETLGRLLQFFAPRTGGAQEPRLPYWFLQSDGLWKIPNADALDRRASGFPKMEALRASSGHLVDEVWDELRSDPAFTGQIVRELLDSYFPSSLHEELANTIGFNLPGPASEPEAQQQESRQRSPDFKRMVLQAYEHRCAVTGFQSFLGGVHFGCEAAHIQWHAYDGPDSVANGIALEPTMHKLFDVGAWTLTTDHRIQVSRDFSGNEEAASRLRSRHGKPINKPLTKEDLPAIEFIRWHRERKFLGGV